MARAETVTFDGESAKTADSDAFPERLVTG
jgi:hypothetical protein